MNRTTRGPTRSASLSAIIGMQMSITLDAGNGGSGRAGPTTHHLVVPG